MTAHPPPPSPPPAGPSAWQPVAQFPTVAALIDNVWEVVVQHRTLLDAIRQQPYTLDAATVGGVFALYTGQRDVVGPGWIATRSRCGGGRLRPLHPTNGVRSSAWPAK